MSSSPAHANNNETISPAELTLGIVSDDARFYTEIILRVGLTASIAILGIAANIANTIIFVKQGLRESASVSLMCLSVFDLGICIITLLFCVGTTVDKFLPDINADVYDVIYIAFSLPRSCFSEMSMLVTVLLSLERCLCVIQPLTFKKIINKRNTKITIAIIVLQSLAFTTTILSVNPLSWIFDPNTNTTRLGRSKTEYGLAILEMANLKSVVVTSCSMIIVVLATLVMSFGLYSSKKFKQSAMTANSGKSNETEFTKPKVSDKEARLVKLVVFISIIFVISYIPFMAMLTAASLVDELTYFGLYRNINDIMWAIIYLVATCNASFNFVVYYFMSSKYKEMLRHLISGSGGKIIAEQYRASFKSSENSM